MHIDNVTNNLNNVNLITYPLELDFCMLFKGGGPILSANSYKNRIAVWADTFLSFINIESRELLWERRSDSYIGGVRAIDDNTLFGFIDSRVGCLNAGSGENIWLLSPDAREYVLASTDNEILLKSKEKKPNPLTCRSKKDGSLVWKFEKTFANPAVIMTYANLVILKNKIGYQAIDKETGSLVWGIKIYDLVQKYVGDCFFKEGDLTVFGPIVNGDLFIGAKGGLVFSIRAETGGFNWVYQDKDELRYPETIIYDNGQLYFNIGQGFSYVNYLTCLKAQSGELIFRTEGNFTPNGCSNPIIANGFLIGGYRDTLSFFDLKKKEFVWSYQDKKKRDIFGAPLHVHNDTIVVHGSNKDLYWFKSVK